MTIDEHRSALLVLRNKVGAESEAGRHISNLIEQLENYQAEPDPKARAWLEKFMAVSVKAIETLIKEAGYGRGERNDV